MTKSEYKLHIHHRGIALGKDKAGNLIPASSTGHFFVSLEHDSNNTYFGKYPEGVTFLQKILSNTDIKSDEERQLVEDLKNLSTKTGEEYISTKTFKLNEEQYNKAIKYASSNTAKEKEYILGISDCTDFAQSLYNAAGLPLYFTVAYSKEELRNLKSYAALKVLLRYGSRDTMPEQFHCMEGLSKEEVASRLNVDPKIVVQVPTFKYWNPPFQQIGDEITIRFHVDIDDKCIKLAEKAVEKVQELDTQQFIEEIKQIILRFKIPSDHKDSDDDPIVTNFHELKHIIKMELLGYKEKVEKILDTKNQTSSCKSQEQLMALYEQKIAELQAKFKATNDYAQKHPGQYKYEPGETLPGMASFNTEQMKLNQWLSEELGNLQNTPTDVKNGASEEWKSTVVQEWNKQLEKLSAKPEFNDKIEETIEKRDNIKRVISRDMEIYLQEVHKYVN